MVQTVTVTADSGCRVFRASIDGVRIITILGKGKSKQTRKLPAGFHTLSWDALGEKGDKYDIQLTLAGSVQCHGQGPLGTTGIDHGSCPFEVF